MSDLEQSLAWDGEDDAPWERRQRWRSGGAAPRPAGAVLDRVARPASRHGGPGLDHSLDDSLPAWDPRGPSPRVAASSAAPFAGPCRACRGDLELRPLRACVDCGRVLHRTCAVVGRCPACDAARGRALPAMGPGLLHGGLGLLAGLAGLVCWAGAWPGAWPAAACATLALSLAGLLASWRDESPVGRLLSWSGLLLVWPPLALVAVALVALRGLLSRSHAGESRLVWLFLGLP